MKKSAILLIINYGQPVTPVPPPSLTGENPDQDNTIRDTKGDEKVTFESEKKQPLPSGGKENKFI